MRDVEDESTADGARLVPHAGAGVAWRTVGAWGDPRR